MGMVNVERVVVLVRFRGWKPEKNPVWPGRGVHGVLKEDSATE
jgi:hypothetical protein